jgi:Protein of unknown function (DUF4235)
MSSKVRAQKAGHQKAGSQKAGSQKAGSQKAGSQKAGKVWSAFSAVAAFVAAAVARKGLTTSWRAATGKKPPSNPADPDVNLTEAVLWAVLSGAVITIARMLATRRAVRYVARSTGSATDRT